MKGLLSLNMGFGIAFPSPRVQSLYLVVYNNMDLDGQ